MKKRTDLTTYMPALPASAADLRTSKVLTVNDRVDLLFDDNDFYTTIVKPHEEACNGYSHTSLPTVIERVHAADEAVDYAKDNNDEILGSLTTREMMHHLHVAKRRRKISINQRRQQAIANQQKAIEDQAKQQAAPIGAE